MNSFKYPTPSFIVVLIKVLKNHIEDADSSFKDQTLIVLLSDSASGNHIFEQTLYNVYCTVTGQCVLASNAQIWPTIIDGKYIADPAISDCGSGMTSYRKEEGGHFLWRNGTGWVGSSVLCSEANPTKQVITVEGSFIV